MSSTKISRVITRNINGIYTEYIWNINGIYPQRTMSLDIPRGGGNNEQVIHSGQCLASKTFDEDVAMVTSVECECELSNAWPSW